MQPHELSPKTAPTATGLEKGSLPPGLTERIVEAKDHIFLVGNPARYLVYLQQGRARLVGYSVNSYRTITLLERHTPGVISADALTQDPVHQLDAKAIEDCTVVYIPQDVLWRLASYYPKFHSELFQSIAQLQADLTRNFLILTTGSIPQRVANALLMKAENGIVYLNNQVEVAEATLCSRESVNKVLVKFAQKGWISPQPRRSTYRIDQPGKLESLLNINYKNFLGRQLA